MFSVGEQHGAKVVFINNHFTVTFTILSAGVIKLQIENVENLYCEKVVDIRRFEEIDYSAKNLKEQLALYLTKEIKFLSITVSRYGSSYVCEVFFQIGVTRYSINLLMRSLDQSGNFLTR